MAGFGNLSPLHRGQNGALLVGDVGAIGVAALTQKGSELLEGVGQILQLKEIEALEIQQGEAGGVGDEPPLRARKVKKLLRASVSSMTSQQRPSL